MLTVQDLSIGFPNRVLFSNISFQVKPGELCALIGANGSGKTSLIRSISGTLPPLSGSVSLDGQAISQLSAKALSKQLSLVNTERIKLGYFRVMDVLELGRSPYTRFFGQLSLEDKRHVHSAIEATSIQHLLDKSMDQLSEGESQKVMIARALVQDTPYIFMDEPSAFLDMLNRMDLFRLLRKLATERKKTILLASHEIELCLKIADKLIILADQIYVKTPKETIESGIMEKLFQRQGLVFKNGRFDFDIL